MLQLLSSNTVRASAVTAVVPVARTAAFRATGTHIEVDGSVYILISLVLSVIGVALARMVMIDAENRRLGRRQTWRETGPLTWIGVLIVCPLIWHFEIAVPWAALVGLGVGYSVRVILSILGRGATGAARAMLREAGAALDETNNPPIDQPDPAIDKLVDKLREP